MKLNQLTERGWPTRRHCLGTRGHFGPLALVLALALLAGFGLFTGTLLADGGASGSGAGGDTVGTLPVMSNPPAPLIDPNGGLPASGPAVPILSLSGPLSELKAMIVDAYGEGYVVLTWLGNGDVRFDFYGHDTVILDRTRFLNSFIKAQITVGSSFQGAIVRLFVNDVLRSTHALSAGMIDTRLRKMTQTGLIDLGVVWHAENAQHTHSVMSFKGTGNLVKIEQRD
jgi:hypothetical protein